MEPNGCDVACLTRHEWGPHAVHEAGHAVVARAVGISVVRLAVVGADSFCEYDPISAVSARPERRLLTRVAGGVAVRLLQEATGAKRCGTFCTVGEQADWFFWPEPTYQRPEFSGDLRKALREAELLWQLESGPGVSDSVDQEYVRRSIGRAERVVRRILQRRWDAVVKLAGALLRSQSSVLAGMELAELLRAT